MMLIGEKRWYQTPGVLPIRWHVTRLGGRSYLAECPAINHAIHEPTPRALVDGILDLSRQLAPYVGTVSESRG